MILVRTANAVLPFTKLSTCDGWPKASPLAWGARGGPPLAEHREAISEKQLEANRRNAQKSTGPRTEEGKAASAANALKHGLTSRRFLLPNEDQSQFNEFLLEMCDHWLPRTNYEYVLLHRVATALWRLQRIPEIEADILLRMAITPDELFNGGEISLGTAFMKDAGQDDALNRLARYETSLQRSLASTTKELERSLRKPLPDFMSQEEEPAGMMRDLESEMEQPQPESTPRRNAAMSTPTSSPEQGGDPRGDEPHPTGCDATNHDYLSQVARNREAMSQGAESLGAMDHNDDMEFSDMGNNGMGHNGGQATHGHGMPTHPGSGSGGNGRSWSGV